MGAKAGGTNLQDVLLLVSRACGLFAISRRLTRRGLRILCYHGFADGDELQFRPGLFIAPATFRARLETLASRRYPVLSLQAALRALEDGTLPSGATVITVDDVFYGFYQHAMPLIDRFKVPVTAYLTTYYCVKDRPVFRLVVQYMLWRTERPSLDLSELDPALNGVAVLTDSSSRAAAADTIMNYGAARASEDARTALASRLGALLGVDYARVASARMFNIVTMDEARSLAARGIDLELHTHRHRLPEVKADVDREIADNQKVLSTLTGTAPVHLCYPSGVWSPVLWPWLESAGIASATTCDAGLNYHDTPRLGLHRILDAEDVSAIRFEAEMAGFKDLFRRARTRIKELVGSAQTPQASPRPL